MEIETERQALRKEKVYKENLKQRKVNWHPKGNYCTKIVKEN